MSSSLIAGAAILEAIIFVFSKRLKPHFDAIEYLAISQCAAAAFMWALQGAFFQQWGSLQGLSYQGWAAALFVSLVACVFCYLVLYWLLNFIDGHKLALFDGVHTLSAAFFGFVLFAEPVNSLMLAGGGLLIAGLVLGNWPVGRSNSKVLE